METWIIGVFGIVLMLVLIAFRVHIAFALAFVGFIGYSVIMGWRPTEGLLGLTPYSFTASFTLTTVPLFLLMGYLAYHSGITSNLYESARLWLSRIPGGMAISSVVGCAAFAAACGSSLATAALMGRIAIPEMLHRGYNRGLAAGCVAAAGTIGSLIPPSILLILYGVMTEVSVGPLLLAGFIPGIVSALIYVGMIWIRSLINKDIGPVIKETITWQQRFVSIKGIWGVPILFLLVIGGIYLGFFTPTEAGGVGAFGAFCIALFTRKLNLANFKESLGDTVRSTSQIFAIGIGASLFTKFIGVSDLPSVICDAITTADIQPILVLMAISLVYIALGMFLDPIGTMLLTLPIVAPVIEGLGLNLIWFGVIMIKYLEIGLITPPVGINVYVIKGVVGDSIAIEEIFHGTLWFLAMDILTLAILIAFPEISLFLPNTMMGN